MLRNSSRRNAALLKGIGSAIQPWHFYNETNQPGSTDQNWIPQCCSSPTLYFNVTRILVDESMKQRRQALQDIGHDPRCDWRKVTFYTQANQQFSVHRTSGFEFCSVIITARPAPEPNRSTAALVPLFHPYSPSRNAVETRVRWLAFRAEGL